MIERDFVLSSHSDIDSLQVEVNKEKMCVLPVIFSKSAIYTGGSFFSYIQVKLIQVEKNTDGKWFVKTKKTETAEEVVGGTIVIVKDSLSENPGVIENTMMTVNMKLV